MAQTLLVVRPDDVRAFGRNAAALLGQIDFWSTKAVMSHQCVIRRNGYIWVAKSRARWCDELVLTPQQLRMAIEKLKRSGVLVAETHLHQNRTTAFFRIDGAELSVVREAYAGKVQNTHLSKVQNTHTGSGVETQTLYTEKKEEKDKENSVGFATPSISGNKDKGSKEEKMPEALWAVNVPKNGLKPANLETLFQTAWSAVYPSEYLPPLTGKELGQLKLFAKACPGDDAGPVLNWCVRNWYIFTSLAEHNQGAFKSPQRPTVGFLLQYVQSAVNGMQSDTISSKSLAKAKMKAVHPFAEPVPQTTTEPLHPDDKIMTLEEVAADMFPENEANCTLPKA